MNMRFLSACTLIGLALAVLPGAARAADTSAVAVVRQFLTDQAAGNSPAAYSLFSGSSQQMVTEAKFAAGDPLPPSTMKQKSDPVFGLAVLLADTRHTEHYVFAVIGPDPADPNTVLVRATPPASDAGVSATTLHLVTVSDPVAHAPRLDVLASLKRAAPQVFAGAAGNAKRAQSLNNLKYLSLAIIQYLQDHDETFPDAAHWVDEIMPYVKDKSFFHDPSAPASQAYSYAYNRNLSHQGLAVVMYPSSLVVLFESTQGVKNASDTGQSVPHPGRHEGGTDCAYADGSAKWVPDGKKQSYKLEVK